ncbi:unnamed protein product [Mucor hiemalis]
MTVLYTETHLTTNPTYIEDNAAFFSIALSSLTLQCHIHRQENIAYLRNNQILQGDLVRLSGVFVTNINEPHFIKVQSLMLAPKATVGKKRRLGDMLHLEGASMNDSFDSSEAEDGSSRRTSLMSTTSNYPFSTTDHDQQQRQTSPLMKNGIYREVDLSFNQLFFMLYGKATFLTEQYATYCRTITNKTPAMLTRDQTIREKTELLLTIFRQVYETSQDLSAQINVINFVSNVRTFIEKINELKNLMPEGLLPRGITIGQSVPLPRQVYQNFMRQ